MPALEPAGYEALIAHYGLECLPHFRRSFIAPRGERRFERASGRDRYIYPRAYRPRGEDFFGGQLEFALKYDGINLGILKALFRRAGPRALASYVRTRPTGKYARRAWFLYEWLLGEFLPLPDLVQGAYVELLDTGRYFTADRRSSRRHRVYDNLFGTPSFCPILRRTDTLSAFAAQDLAAEAREIVARYSPEQLARASRYLYVKETRSSYEIERERPSRDRTQRFVAMLQRSGQLHTVDKQTLLELQQAALDPRFAADDYRRSQNYVGETVRSGREIVHFVGPPPDAVPELMDGLFACMNRMGVAAVDPVVQAAVASFGFVFIHPFEDGNGRTHRFLIHHVLSRTGFTPGGTIFPVSAVMLANRAAYDRALESFSQPLVERVRYELGADGEMTVLNDTADLYRYLDATPLAEYLYAVVKRTIDHEFVEELDFLDRYDWVKERMQSVVDLPDRQLDLLVRLLRQNRGHLSQRKRETEFRLLTDDEIVWLEAAFAEGFDV